MGQELYIVTSPKYVLSVYKNSRALDFDPVIRNIMSSFGLKNTTLNLMFQKTADGKSWMDMCHDNFKLQMHPGEKLDKLQATFLKNIDDYLKWEKLSGAMVVNDLGCDKKTVSLYKWCGEVLVESATRAFFGGSIFQVDKNLLPDFFIFDS